MIIEVPSVSQDALEMSNGGPPSDVVPSNVAPSDVAPSDLAPAPDEIVVTAREAPPPGDPLQEANIKSYRVIQSVDKALVAPVATGYPRVLPEPVRDGLGNALRTISEPVTFLNFLFPLQIGTAAEQYSSVSGKERVGQNK